LQAFERGVNGASGDLAIESCFDFPENRATVGIVREAHDCQQHRLFEATENVAHVIVTTL
jgi:hypothetical protein